MISEWLGWYRNKLHSMFSEMAAALEEDRKISLHYINKNRDYMIEKGFLFFCFQFWVSNSGLAHAKQSPHGPKEETLKCQGGVAGCKGFFPCSL